MQRLADVVVAPLVPDVLDGEEAVTEVLDAAPASRLAEGSLSAVTVRQGDGRVLYSSGLGGTGTTLAPPAEVALALRGVTTSAFQQGFPKRPGARADRGRGGAVRLGRDPGRELRAHVRADGWDRGRGGAAGRAGAARLSAGPQVWSSPAAWTSAWSVADSAASTSAGASGGCCRALIM